MASRTPTGAATASAAPAVISETDWSNWVAELAHIHHWAVAHWRPAQTNHGWRTACQYDAAGFPDLILVHPLRQLVLYRELKVGRNKLDEKQWQWRHWLTQAGADWDIWTPADRDEVVRILTDDRARAI